MSQRYSSLFKKSTFSFTYSQLFFLPLFVLILFGLMAIYHHSSSDSSTIHIEQMDDDLYVATAKDYSLGLSRKELIFKSEELPVPLSWHIERDRDLGTIVSDEASEELWYKGMHEGVDMRVYNKGEGNAGYDLILEPGADPRDIVFLMEGANSASVAENGDLLIEVPDGRFRHSAPIAYQEIGGEKVDVSARFLVGEDRVGFQLGSYNSRFAVVIDPTVSFEPYRKALSSSSSIMGTDFNIIITTPGPADGIDQFTECGGARPVTVSMQNLSGLTLTGVQVTVSLPGDFGYIEGSAGGDATETSNAPITYSLGDVINGGFINFDFEAEALCGALDNQTIDFSFTYTGGGGSCDASTDPITVLEADLSIISVEGNAGSGFNPVLGAYLNLVDTVKATVRNAGNGAIDSFLFYTLAHPTVQVDSVIECSSGYKLTQAGVSGDTTFYLVGQASVNQAAGGASPIDPDRFERNESIEFCIMLRVIQCDVVVPDLEFGVVSSCSMSFDDLCNTTAENIGVDYDIFAPIMTTRFFTTGEPYPLCLGPDTYAEQGFMFVNTGDAPADSFSVNLHSWSNWRGIDTTSIRVKLGSAGSFQKAGAFILSDSWNAATNGCLNIHTNESHFAETVRLGFGDLDLLPDDTLFITYNLYSPGCECTTSNFECIAEERHWSLVRNFVTTNTCEQVVQNQSYNTFFSYSDQWPGFSANISSFLETPLITGDGQVNQLYTTVTDYNNVWLTDYGRASREEYYYDSEGFCTDCYTEVEYILEEGIDWTGTDGDLVTSEMEWRDNDGTVWIPDYITYTDNNGGNDTLTIRWNGAPPSGFSFNDIASLISFNYIGDAVEAGLSGCLATQDVTIFRNTRFVPDPTCGTCEGEILECQEDILTQLVFSEPDDCICDGLVPSPPEAQRANLGLPDADQDGNSDAGPYDENVLRRDRYIAGDTIEVSAGGRYTAGNAGINSFAYTYHVIEFNNNNFLPLGGEVSIFKNGGATYTCNVLTQTYDGNHLVTDLSPVRLNGNGCGIPDTEVFEDGDSIHVRIFYRSTEEFFGEEQLITNDTRFFAATDPYGGAEYNCGINYPFRLTQIGITGKSNHQRSPSGFIGGCSRVLYRYNFARQLGVGTLDYFPGEYRSHFDVPVLFKQFIPTGYTPDEFYLWVGDKNHNNGDYDDLGNTLSEADRTNLVPWDDPSLSIVGDTVYFNPITFFQTNFGLSDYPESDEGISVFMGTYFMPNCDTDSGTTSASFHVEHRTDPNLFGSSSYDTSFSTLFYYSGGANLEVAPVTFNYQADQSPLCIQFDLANDGTSTSNNTWLAFESLSGAMLIQNVVETTGGANDTLSDNGFGLYQLGNLASFASRSFEVCLISNACDVDSLQILSGFDCLSYPNTVEEAGCNFSSSVSVTPLPTDLRLQVVEPSSDPFIADFCSDTITYVVDLNSSNLGYLYDILLEFDLPAGADYVPGSFGFTYPLATIPPADGDYVSVADPVNLYGNTWQMDISALSSILTDDGLIGSTAPGIENIVYVRFDMAVDCETASGSRAIFRADAKEACGRDVESQASNSPVIQINGVSPVFQTQLSGEPDTLNACRGASLPMTASFEVLAGSLPTGTGDSLRFVLPGGLMYIPNAAYPAPVISEMGGPVSQVLSYPIPAGMIAGDDYSVTVEVGPSGANLECRDYEVVVQTFNEQQLACTPLGINCAADVLSDEVRIPLTIEKPEALIVDFAASSTSIDPNQEEVILDLTIFNPSLLEVDAGADFFIDIYTDDGDGRLSGGDMLLGGLSFDSGIPAGDTIMFTDTIVVNSGTTCGLMAVVDSAKNCVCISTTSFVIDSDLDIPFAKSDTACSNEAISFGPTTFNGYSYQWLPLDGSDTTAIADTRTSPVTFQHLNTTGQTINWEYVLLTDRGGCYVYDTMAVTIFPYTVDSLSTEVCGPVLNCGAGSGASFDLSGPLGGTDYVWTIASGDVLAVIDEPNNPLSAISSGISVQTVFELNYRDANNCPAIFRQTVNTLDCACTQLGDTVWLDLDMDGLQEAGEPGIEGLTVFLYKSNDLGTPIQTTFTDADGFYSFAPLPAGEYVVRFDTSGQATGYPAIYPTTQDVGNDEIDSDANPVTGFTGPYYIPNGISDLTVDAGFYPGFSLGNTVWIDSDNSGDTTSTPTVGAEPGVSGVWVVLLNSGGMPIDSTYTDGNGRYVFTGLPAGDYQVMLDSSNFGSSGVLEGYFPSSGSAGENDPDSDGDYNNNGLAYGESGYPGDPISNGILTNSVTLGASNEPTGETPNNDLSGVPDDFSNLTVDIGLFLPVSVGDTAWVDNDGDGLQEIGEPGLEGVVVTLYDATTGTQVTTDALGNTIVPDTTDSNGAYLFENLPPGEYYTVFDVTNAPNGSSYVATAENANGTPLDGTDSDINNSGVSDTTQYLGSGQSDMTLDAGFFIPVIVGDTAWVDNDANGLQDPGEPGLADVVVTLYHATTGTVVTTDASGDPIVPDTTDANGHYRFENLPPGEYYVVFDVSNSPDADGYAPTSPDAVGNSLDELDSDADSTTGQTASTGFLSSGEADTTLDAGFVPLFSLGNQVYFDTDNSSLLDGAEVGVDGVRMELYEADFLGNPTGALLAADTTSSGGYYRFDGLIPGNYVVVIPESNFESGGVLNGYHSSGTSITSAGTTTETAPADANLDIESDDNGSHQTSGTFAGAVVSESINLGLYEPTDDSTNTPGHPGGSPDEQSNLTLDFGFYQVGLGNVVWEDTDNDGLYEPGDGETGVPNVQVQLFASNGITEIQVGPDGLLGTADDAPGGMLTDVSGNYSFGNLPEGDYIVKIFPPTGYESSTGTIGSPTGAYEGAPDPDNEIDNDDNGTMGTGFNIGRIITETLSIAAGDADLITDDATGSTSDNTIDLGIYRPHSLGNYVWYDTDRDGSFDVGENGIFGVQVNLYPDTNQDGEPDGAAILSTTTSANGYYLFTDVPGGDYVVGIDPGNFAGSAALEDYASSGTSLSGNTEMIAPMVNANATDSDDNGTLETAGSYSGYVLSSTINLDADEPLLEPITPDHPVDLTPDAQTNYSVDFGFYLTASLGDTVWVDADADGIQDAGEVGIDNLVVYLIDAAADTLLDSTYTNPDGFYEFDRLAPDVPYAVQFGTPSGGYLATYENEGANDSTDSDVDRTSGLSPDVTLSAGEHNPTIDAGFFIPVSVGDTTWIDANADGIQDPTEAPLEGVTVTLYDTNADTVVTTDAEGNPITGSTTTDPDGSYLFENLRPGDYYVVFDVSTADPEYLATYPNEGADDAADSDADRTSGESGETGFLSSGEEDMSLDAGFFIPVEVGDTTWVDANADGIQDLTEAPLEGVTVTLYDTNADTVVTVDAEGNPITGSTTTAADGSYLFDNLRPGDYYVIFDVSTATRGAEYLATYPNEGTDDAADSDADRTSGASGETGFLASDEEDMSLDAGFFIPVEVGDTTWIDFNANGIQDPTEDPLEGVTVTLYDTNADTVVTTDAEGNPITGSTTTDPDGSYLFDNLRPGDYYVVFDVSTADPKYLATYPNEGADDAADSDADRTSGASGETGFLASDEEDMSLDAGFFIPVEVGDTTWVDANGNGIQDAGEAGLEGVTVTLYDSNADTVVTTDAEGNPITGSTTTNPDGSYLFDNLRPGDYYVVFDVSTATNGPEYLATYPNEGADDAADSDADRTSGESHETGFLGSDEEDLTLDAGFFIPVEVGDTTWVDANADGIQDPTEAPLEGVTVTLYDTNADTVVTADAEGNPITGSTTTAADGSYLFDNLRPGDYYVVFDVSTATRGAEYLATYPNEGADDAADSDADRTSGASGETGFLSSGEEDMSLDAGFFIPVEVGDTTWVDANADGIQDPTEAPLEGVTVTLYDTNADTVVTVDAEGNPITGSTTTAADGSYLFDNLRPGDYYVVFDVSTATRGTEYLATYPNEGADDAADSDADRTSGASGETGFLSSDEEDMSLDAGFFIPVEVGDTTWIDANADGIQDPTEAPLEGVTVTLYDTNADTVVTVDAEGNPITGSTTTAADGSYLFDNLRPGDYYVIFDVSTATRGAEYLATYPDEGADDAADSDADRTSGESGETGFLASDEEDMSLDAGFFIPVEVGDTTWIDYNANGIQDPTEDPLEGVTVTLYDTNADTVVTTDAEGNPITGSTTTAADGSYLFENLRPGDYYVVFDVTTATRGAEYLATYPNEGADDAADSDADRTSGASGETGFLASDEEDMSLDAGFFIPVEVGDTTWVDANGNGIQDAGEAGLEGVTVTLYDSNADTVVTTDAEGNPITGSTTTNPDGSYLFDNLRPGDYYVVFDVSTATNGPEYLATYPNEGADDAADSDADRTSGESHETGFLGSDEEDLTLDAGFFIPVEVGDTTWVDANADGIQDPTEAPLEGVTVTLYDTNADTVVTVDAEGNPITGSTTTAADGSYLFDNLRPGDYYVIFDVSTATRGAEYLATYPNEGTDDAADSDADRTSGESGETGFLSSGEEDMSLDAGFFIPVEVGDTTWVDANADGIQDPTEAPLEGVRVTLYDTNADTVVTVDAAGNPITGSTTTAADGSYLFDNLRPGDYYVIFDVSTATRGAEYLATYPNEGTDDAADSDADRTSGESGETGFLASDEEDMSLDAGFFIPVEVGDTTWIDFNANGIQDPTEAPLEGVRVTLYDTNADTVVTVDAAGNPITGSTTTAADGSYLFENLRPGDYYVIFDVSTATRGAEYLATYPDEGADDAADSDADRTSGESGETGFLASDQEDMSLDAGFFIPVEVGDTTWVDANGNGIQDAGEAGLEGVTVTLYDSNADTVVTTDAEGNPITGSTTTDPDGSYLFDNLRPGDYYVVFDVSTATNGPEYLATYPNEGADDAADSDADRTSGESHETGFLGSDEEDLTLDAGFFIPVEVGDTTWVDANADGIQDPTEAPLEGVTVTLYDTNADTVVTVDAEGNPITGSTTTAADGSYLFDNLRPGDYYVVFDVSTATRGTEYLATYPNEGADDAADSDADRTSGASGETGFLSSGEEDMSLDAGFFIPVEVGDTTWVDANADGIQDPTEAPLEGVTVTLYDTNADTVVTVDAEGNPITGSTTTAADGSYLFDNLRPGDYYVVFDVSTATRGAEYLATYPDEGADDAADSDADRTSGESGETGFLASDEEDMSLDAGFFIPVEVGDTTWIDYNANGIQDPTEDPLEGVTVTLYDTNADTVVTTDAEGNPITGSTTTAADGSYLFENLRPGDYYVVFDVTTATRGAEYLATYPNEGTDDAADSDADRTSGASGETGFLASDEEDMSLDAGFFIPVEVGDTTWVDANGNGIQDAGEAGLEGVTVTLYDSNADTVVTTDAEGNPITGSTTTNPDGSYLFDNLRPGDYYVVFDVSTADPKYLATYPNEGSDDTADSDADRATGESPETGFLGSGDEDLSLDAGFFIPVEVGDTVWVDNDADGIQEAGEPGLEGVRVTLYDSHADTVVTVDAEGNPITGSTTTAADGSYLFENLPPGDYYVIFDVTSATNGPNYLPTAINQGLDDAMDSDADSMGVSSETGFLASGDKDKSLDAGFFLPAALGDYVWEDIDRDGKQDLDEEPLDSILVILYDSNSGTPLDSAYTDSSGYYLFEGLRPGVSYQVEFEGPDFYATSPQDVDSDDLDSDVSELSGRAHPVILTSGQTDSTIDAGFYPLNFDLELEKRLMANQLFYLVGDTVDYQLIVSNTGEIDAYSIQVADYIPEGLALVDTAQWMQVGDTAYLKMMIPGPLAIGEADTLSISFEVLPDAAFIGVVNNIAEIEGARRSDDTPGEDIDSTPSNESDPEDDQDEVAIQIQPCPSVCEAIDWDPAAALNHGLYLYQTPLNIGFPNGTDTDEQRFVWVEPGQLIQYADSMILTGHLVSKVDTNYSFEVFMKFIQPHSWASWSAKGREYMAQEPAAAAVADTAHANWTYWILDPISRLVGRDSLDGDVLYLTHTPADSTKGFQLGYGANDKDGSYGFGGWFTYSGTLMGEAYESQGDINLDLTNCQEDCFPMLPTIVSTFSATAVGNSHTQLSWGTILEGEEGYVVVERSTDGMLFQAVAEVEGTTSRNPDAYFFRDTEAQGAQTYFYRLKIVRPDGSFVYTQVLSVSFGENQGQSAFYILYPNPVRDILTLEGVNAVAGKHTIKLYDAIGREIYSIEVDDMNVPLMIEMGDLPQGTYNLQINRPDGQQDLHKISVRP